MSEPMPVVEVQRTSGIYGPSESYIIVGPLYLTDYSDSAYVYDPEGEEPYEVAERGSWELSLSMHQARDLRDKLNKILGDEEK